MFLTDLHCRVALAIAFFAFALGVWGVVAYLRGSGVSSSYFGALLIGEVLFIAQALVGVVLFVLGRVPAESFVHVLYGIVLPLSWAAVYVYTKGAQTRREMLIYGIVSFFVMGLAIRGIMTGASSPSCVPF